MLQTSGNLEVTTDGAQLPFHEFHALWAAPCPALLNLPNPTSLATIRCCALPCLSGTSPTTSAPICLPASRKPQAPVRSHHQAVASKAG